MTLGTVAVRPKIIAFALYTRHDCNGHDCATTAIRHDYRNDDDDSRAAADGGGSAVTVGNVQ